MRQFCIGSGNQCDKNCKTASKINISHSYKYKSFHLSRAMRIYYKSEYEIQNLKFKTHQTILNKYSV